MDEPWREDPEDDAGVGAAGGSVLWIPLGAGQRVVELSGRAFEALSAGIGRRPRRALFHAALVVSVSGVRSVVEVAPVPDHDGAARGVVGGGPVGSRHLGRLRWFRYEVRRWPGGVIPDEGHAVQVHAIDLDGDRARRLLELVAEVPTPVWGRDELRAGEMWNSNSVVAWVLARGGLDTDRLGPPPGGRAPGWDAGLLVAARGGPRG